MFIKKLIKNSFIFKIYNKLKNFILFSTQIFFFHKKLSKLKKIKIIIGAGNTNFKNWLSTNICLLNLTDENSFKKLLKNHKVDNFLAEHVFEHLTFEEAKLATFNCSKYLKKGGVLRIAVPDGFFPDKNYINQVKPGGYGAGAHDHKEIYNYQTIRKIFDENVFKLNFFEFFDENSQFQYKPANQENGHIIRSRFSDPRNTINEIKYTSIILDAIKQ